MSDALSKDALRRLLRSAAETDDPPDLERYRLVRELGRGGMGVVHEAEDLELGRRVAIKLLHDHVAPNETARLRFVREARAAARLAHPNIAAVYDANERFLVLQLVEGATLEDAQLDARGLAASVRDAALAIHYAHGQGVVHRDLKPANVMITDARHTSVMDFGLAKELEVDTSLSATGGVIGTPATMAPEQARGAAGEIGPRTDVYGLGTCLYHGLTGRLPFQEESVWSTLRAVIERDPPPVRALAPDVPVDLAWIVQTCLQKEPVRRYGSALALASDLERWLAGETVAARPPSLVYRARRFLSRRQGAVAASLVAAALVVLIALPSVLAARRERALTDRVFRLSGEVERALEAGRTRRSAGAGLEEGVHDILEAAADACRAFLADAEVPYAHFALGRVLRAQGKLSEALAAFDDAAGGASPAQPLVGLQLERGLVLAELWRDGLPLIPGDAPAPDQAELRERGRADLRLAVDGSSEPTAPALYAAGMLAWLEGDELRAVRDLRAATETDPVHLDAHLSLVGLHAARGEGDAALRHSWIANDILSGHRAAFLPRSPPRSEDGEVLAGAGEPLAFEGAEELFVDFGPRLATDPGNANQFGLRGQVQARRALRLAARGDASGAAAGLEDALRELDSGLRLVADDAGLRTNRGACRAALERLHARAGRTAPAAELRAGALEDYDRALAQEDAPGVAFFDRALLHLRRAEFARMGLDGERYLSLRASAVEDLRAALGALPSSAPYRDRIEKRLAELVPQ